MLQILYENISISLITIEFGPINDDFSLISLHLVTFYENIIICFYHIKCGPINDDFPRIT